MSSPTISIPSWRGAQSGVSPGEREGSRPSNAGVISASSPLAARALADLTHFELAERLVQVWIRNQRNLRRLEELEARIEGANRRLASSERGRALVEAHRERPRTERLAILLQLRADDRLASDLLDEFESRRRTSSESSRAFSA